MAMKERGKWLWEWNSEVGLKWFFPFPGKQQPKRYKSDLEAHALSGTAFKVLSMLSKTVM